MDKPGSVIFLELEEEVNETHNLPVFPKPLAEREIEVRVDENGFTMSEKAALRNAWRFIEPFERRYGKDNFYTFLTEHEYMINVFRQNHNTINLSTLHHHALSMMKLLTRLVHNIGEYMEFRSALEENLPRHVKAGVDTKYMKMLSMAIKDYLLASPQLCKQITPTLTNAMDRLLTIVGEHAHTEEVRKRAMSLAYTNWQIEGKGSDLPLMIKQGRSSIRFKTLSPEKRESEALD